MATIPPSNSVENTFLNSPAFTSFTQNASSLAQLPGDSIDPNSAKGSQVAQSIYNGETLLATLASMASASPSMSAWVTQEGQTISQQITQEGQLLNSSSTASGLPAGSGLPTGSDKIAPLVKILQGNPTPSQSDATMSTIIATEEQAAPNDAQLQQDGTKLEATLSAYRSDPSSQNHQAVLDAQNAFIQRMHSDAGSATASPFASEVNKIVSSAMNFSKSSSSPKPSAGSEGV